MGISYFMNIIYKNIVLNFGVISFINKEMVSFVPLHTYKFGLFRKRKTLKILWSVDEMISRLNGFSHPLPVTCGAQVFIFYECWICAFVYILFVCLFVCLFDLMLYVHGKQLRSCFDSQLS